MFHNSSRMNEQMGMITFEIHTSAQQKKFIEISQKKKKKMKAILQQTISVKNCGIISALSVFH